MSIREAILRNQEAGPPPISIRADGVPPEIRATPRWLTWDWEWKGHKWTKPPKSCDGRRAGSSTDSTTWGTLEDALETHRGTGLGIGFALNGDGIIGFDFDDVRDPASGVIADWALEMIQRLDSYAEVSPSGTGVKVLVRGMLPEKIGSKFPRKDGGAVELFSSGRYFTISGQRLEDFPASVRDNQAGIDSVLATVKAWNERPKPVSQPAPPFYAPNDSSDRETALAALRAIHPASLEYQQWVDVGMALHSVDPGFLREFDHWSQQDKARYVEGEPAEKWASFKTGGGIGLDTLCKLADDATGRKDWRPERHGQHVDTSAIDGRQQQGWRYDQRAGQPEAERPAPRVLVPQFKTFEELERQHPRMRPAVIDPIARQGETVNIIANPKFGKSWLVAGLGLHVQTGRPWLGRFNVLQGDVLVIDNELHAETISHRLPIVADAYGIGPSEWKGRLCVEGLRGRLASIVEMGTYFQQIEKGRFRCIILDAKYRFGADRADENSNADEMRFYNLVDQYAEQTEATFILIHHATKGDQSGKATTDIGAGGGAQSRAADTHLVLRQHEQENCAVMEAAVRSFPPFDPVVLRWEFPAWTIDEDLDPAAIKKPASKADDAQRKRDEEGIAKIRKLLLSGPKTRRQIRDKYGFGAQRLSRLIDVMDSEIDTSDEELVRLV